MNEWIIFCGIASAAVFLMGWQGFKEKKRQRERAEKQISEEYGASPGENRGRAELYARFCTEDKSRTGGARLAGEEVCSCPVLDDITWNDLDMDLIFRRVNYARCSAGAWELYRILRCPAMEEDVLRERDILADRMMEDGKLRVQLSMALHGIGFTGKYAPEDYLNHLDRLGERKNGKHILTNSLYLPAVTLFFFRPLLGMALLFLALLVNIVTYFAEKGEVSPYLANFAYLLRMIRGAEKMGAILEKACGSGQSGAGRAAGAAKEESAEEILSKYREMLKKDVGELESFRKFSGMAMSLSNPVGGSGPFDILFDYLKMAFHPDLIKFNQMAKVVRQKEGAVKELSSAVGTLDACLSIAYFRASLESYCRPEWSGSFSGDDAKDKRGVHLDGRRDPVPEELDGMKTGGASFLEAEELYHPLLVKPVKNSIAVKRGVLVTGSNASGKSTFLKMAALGAVLAQTLCTVPARRWSSPFYRVMSSMALRDNLTGGESYFVVEIKALKRILDACGEEMPSAEEDAAGRKCPNVLCFVDEVLRGTNTVERIAASARILRSLSGGNALCFAATHDIELTYLLEDCYENYHFEETIEDGDISFHYQLKKGRAQSKNAIRLLEVMGYDRCVIAEAEEMAERFLKTGEWSV